MPLYLCVGILGNRFPKVKSILADFLVILCPTTKTMKKKCCMCLNFWASENFGGQIKSPEGQIDNHLEKNMLAQDGGKVGA